MNTHLNRTFKSFFVESRFISLIAVIAVAALRFFMFLKKGMPDLYIDTGGFIWPLIDPIFRESPLLSLASSTLSIFIIAYLLSELNIRYGIIRTRTALPFYIPLLLFSVHPYFLGMTPDFPALIFLLWSLFPLLASYQFHRPQIFAFQFTTLIVFAALFQIRALLLLPVWLIGFAAMGGMNFRSLTASFLGALMVFWIVFAVYVFGNNIEAFVEPFKCIGWIYDFSSGAPQFTVPQWGFIGTVLLLLLTLIFADNRQISWERSFTKKVLIFSVFALTVLFLLQILYLFQTFFWMYVAFAFISIIIAHFYTNTTSRLGILSFFLFCALLIFYFSLNLFSDLSPF